MGSRVLIVEDQFLEANDLKITLENAGHSICGVAKSVEQAIQLLRKGRPEVVLLDILLKGELTGIDLAKVLAKENTPFIYLSANSNPSTFDAAKATQPYGFLVKPFREMDVLAALDIASYRHKHNLELMLRQEKWLSHLLGSIIKEGITQEEKLERLAKAFRPFINFEYLFVDMDVTGNGLDSIHGFQRLDYDEYKYITGHEFLEGAGLPLTEVNYFKKHFQGRGEIQIRVWAPPADEANLKRAEEKIQFAYGVQSNLWVPLSGDKTISMSLSFYNSRPDSFSSEHVELLSPLKQLLFDVLESIREQRRDSAAPAKENVMADPTPGSAISGIVGKSPGLLQALDQVTLVAPFDTTVLIMGETGSGKEGLASATHRLSSRRAKPFIKINCAAIPQSLFESELFGYEKGAFTDAAERRIGKFEQAQGGTLLLDEIGEIPLEIQGKLLRVLQEKELERIGGRTTIKVDVRIIAITNRNLYKEAAAGRFRLDLYYRLNVFPIQIPPLRERKEDIPLLVDHFLLENEHMVVNGPKKIAPGALQQLVDYSWPGNIRELQHLIERQVLINRSPVITSIDLPVDRPIDDPQASHAAATLRSIADIDKAHIMAVLKQCKGKVSGKGGAAAILKIPATTLASKMKRLGITWNYLLE